VRVEHAATVRVEHAAELQIDLGAIVANWQALRVLHPTGPVAAIVKADGYGLGATEIARTLYDAGCRHIFTAHLREAIPLRPIAPDAMLAVLNGPWLGDEPAYRDHNILPVLGSLPEIDAWHGEALLHIDTGMNRLGLAAEEIQTLAAHPSRLAHLDLRYVMTHLAAAETPGDPLNETQRRRFAEARAALALDHTPTSLANSAGLFLGPAFASDLARPGAAIYGVNPTPGRPNPMRPTATLRARILQTRRIPAGETVGYNGTWTAPRTSTIGTISVGYADGFLRSLSNRAEACFDGVRVPLVGRVSMDLATFDLTGTAAQAGDWLELLGSTITVDELAARAGTTGYEILTSLGPRYRRIYTKA